VRHFYIKTIVLSRQARDKHRESTQKTRVAAGGGPNSSFFSNDTLLTGAALLKDALKVRRAKKAIFLEVVCSP
jgi:hypothetical protein